MTASLAKIVTRSNGFFNIEKADGTFVFESDYYKIERVSENMVKLIKKTSNGHQVYNFAKISEGKELFREWFEKVTRFDEKGHARAVTARGAVCTITTSGMIEMN